MTNQWGVVRYAAGSGQFPEQDCAAFDGWYSTKTAALAVYHLWCQSHPNWIVALVKADPDNIRFSKAAWERVVDRAILTDGTLCPLKREAR